MFINDLMVSNNNLYIGIDASYKNTGIAGIYGSSGKFELNKNVFLVSVSGKKDKDKKRFGKSIISLDEINYMVDGIYKSVIDIIRVCKQNVCKSTDIINKIYVGIEYGYMFGAKSYHLAMLNGAVAGKLNDITDINKLMLVNVSSARKLLNIKKTEINKIGGGNIKVVIYKLWEQLGIKCNNYDESDALTIAYYISKEYLWMEKAR